MTLIELGNHHNLSEVKHDNPLVWPLLTVLQESNRSWKVHWLATELQRHNLLLSLDNDPAQDLFKRNFLLMNALFQLQQILLPEQWLQVHAMDIQILSRLPIDLDMELHQDAALRDYYLDWENYDINTYAIHEMLEQFWYRYEEHVGTEPKQPSCNLLVTEALNIFELSHDSGDKEIRRQWRRLALRWHPDRNNGNAGKFRRVCEAWQILRR